MAIVVGGQETGDHILYVIILPREGSGQFSPFQGFSVNTLAVVDVIQHLCTLPATITELFHDRDEVIRWRSFGLGGYAIVLLDLRFLDGLVAGFGGFPVICLISGPDNQDFAERHVASKDSRQFLHLTTGKDSSEVPKLWSFTRADMYSWSRRIAEKIVAERSGSASVPADVHFRTLARWPKETIPLKTRSHNITLPTEMALESLGISLTKGGEPLTGRTDDEFARAISEVAGELDRVRHSAIGGVGPIPGTPSLILTVPSVYRHLSPGRIARDAPRPVRKVVRHVLRQGQYIAMRTTGEEGGEILRDPMAHGAMYARARELQAYTAALSVASASLCAPVIRCPPQIDRVRELLIRLEGMTRSRVPHIERKNRLARSIGVALRRAIPDPLFQIVEQRQHEGIKFIGDTPLELVPVGDLPLGLRATTSRMPTLPGNLLMRQGLLRAPAFLKPNDLRRILVVRAFGPGDPIRHQLVRAVQTVTSNNPDVIELRVVDVSSKDDFVAAFNNFDGALAIFDGHGAHSRNDPEGTIAVGRLRFNPFELYDKIRVPPIVFLSACETHTLQGIESSVATAFLLLGSCSVLATQVPIDGLRAAILIARFMLRFVDFLPQLRAAIPWSEVVAGMLRMSYVTDVLRSMRKRFSFGRDEYLAIHSKANLAINRFQTDWFEKLLVSLSEATSRSEGELRDVWLRTCYFTETLHYVHLGQPEHLFVRPADEIADEEV